MNSVIITVSRTNSNVLYQKRVLVDKNGYILYPRSGKHTTIQKLSSTFPKTKHYSTALKLKRIKRKILRIWRLTKSTKEMY
jgi:hypothetical protein